MRTLNDILTEHKNQLQSEFPLIWCYELETSDEPPQRFRYTNATERVNHGVNSAGAPIVYYPAPIVHGGIQESGEGDIPTLEVTVANISLEIAPRLDAAGGWVGNRAVVHLISSINPEETMGTIRIDLEVVGAAMTPLTSTFNLGAYNTFRSNFPPFLYTKRHCRWIFGGPECGYVLGVGGAYTSCRNDLTDCRLKGDDEVARGLPRMHPRRFGGKPGIPPQGRIR